MTRKHRRSLKEIALPQSSVAGMLTVMLLAASIYSQSAPQNTQNFQANSQTIPASGPGGRNKPGFVYDSARKQFVLFGGFGRRGEKVKDDTWNLHGSRWERIDTTGPSPRGAMGMAYESRRRRVVLFGGTANSTPLSDTWEWDGKTWKQLATAGPFASPSARAGLQMAYDSRRHKVIMFGGSGEPNQPAPGDTWEWDGDKWRQVSSSGPVPRVNHSLAYDSHRGKVVLFGGNSLGAARERLGDTWEWNSVKWSKVADSESLKRDHHGMSYDSARRRVVLFGGSNGNFLGDTWEWDGTRWVEHKVAGPSARGGIPSMAYDTEHKKVVLFGGWDATGPVVDIWEWDGQLWKQIK